MNGVIGIFARSYAPTRPGTHSGVFATLGLWYERAKQRRHLAGLDDRLLRDIGVDRATAMEEASKPFWRP